jgi:hypothetical protein
MKVTFLPFTRGVIAYVALAVLLLGVTLMAIVPLLPVLSTHVRIAALYLGSIIWVVATLMPLGSMLINELRKQKVIKEKSRVPKRRELRDNSPRPINRSSVVIATYIQAAVATLHELGYEYPYFGTQSSELSSAIAWLDQAKKAAKEVEIDYLRAAATTDFLVYGLPFETLLSEVQSALEKTQPCPSNRHPGDYFYYPYSRLPISSFGGSADQSIESCLQALLKSL